MPLTPERRAEIEARIAQIQSLLTKYNNDPLRKYVEPIEKASGIGGLAGLGLMGAGGLLSMTGVGAPAGAPLMALGGALGTGSSLGLLGSGAYRMSRGQIGPGALEAGLGALGSAGSLLRAGRGVAGMTRAVRKGIQAGRQAGTQVTQAARAPIPAPTPVPNANITPPPSVRYAGEPVTVPPITFQGDKIAAAARRIEAAGAPPASAPPPPLPRPTPPPATATPLPAAAPAPQSAPSLVEFRDLMRKLNPKATNAQILDEFKKRFGDASIKPALPTVVRESLPKQGITGELADFMRANPDLNADEAIEALRISKGGFTTKGGPGTPPPPKPKPDTAVLDSLLKGGKLMPSAGELAKPRPTLPGAPKEPYNFLKSLAPHERTMIEEGRKRAADAGIKSNTVITRELDRSRIEYERTKEALAELKKLTGGEQAGEFTRAQLDRARDYLGRRLQAAGRTAKNPRVRTTEQMEAGIRKAMGDAGFSSVELMTKILGATAGGATGASFGETPLERTAYGLGGAAMGASAPGMIKNLVQHPTQTFEDLTFFSFLSSPRAMIKAGMGGIGAAMTKATEMITEGIASGDPRLIVNGGRILKHLSTKSPKTWARAMADPNVSAKIVGHIPGKTPTSSIGGIGRIYSAGDAAAVEAMQAGGITAEEAMRLTLSGTPTTDAGQNFVSVMGGKIPRGRGGKWEKDPITGKRTLNRNLNPIFAFGARQAAPFARTGVQMVERGLLERTPLGLPILASKSGRAALSPGSSPLQLLIRQGGGLGAIGAGASLEEEVPLPLQPFAASMLGPYALPYAMGAAISRAQRSGKPLYTAVESSLADADPIGRDPLGIVTRPRQELASRLVPGIIADFARATDPAYNRQTGSIEITEAGGDPLLAALGPLAARVPGIRTKLPEELVPTDVFGVPRIRYQRPDASAIENLMLKMVAAPPRAEELPPAMDLSDPRLAALKEAGVGLRPPSGNLELGGMDIPLSTPARQALQRSRGDATSLAVNILSDLSKDPAISSLTPELKKLLFERILQRVRSKMSGLSTLSALDADAQNQP